MSKKDKGSSNGSAELSNDQVTALHFLKCGKTLRFATLTTQANEAMVSQWLHKDEEFIEAYKTCRQSLYDASQAEILALRRKAVEALEELLDSNQPDIRLKAIDLVYKYSAVAD